MNAIVPVHAAAVAPVEDVWRMAQAVARSGLFGMKSPEEAMALMLIAQAEGQHPAVAARDYHIVEGKPSLKADAMLARFIQAGGKVKWSAYTDEKVEATFSHPQGGEVTLDWTIERATKITSKGKKITDKDNWRNYPRQMLRARVISEGIRTVYPGVAVGVYTPEEVEDFDGPREPRNVTPRRQAVADTVAKVAPEDAPNAPPSPEGHGLYVACKAAIDLAEDRAAMQQWADDNEASLAKIFAEAPEVYEAILAYWKARLKSLPKARSQSSDLPPAAADQFGLAGDEIPTEFS